jgi:alkylhydroperoxidase/carboxymuconolactone decarboxylase family protein YurZ
METARDLLGKREANMKRLEKEAPHLVHGFKEFITDCFRPGALDRKQKELMAVAATIAVRCAWPIMQITLLRPELQGMKYSKPRP